LRRRIFFFRHFQRCLPRFFHAREERFREAPARRIQSSGYKRLGDALDELVKPQMLG